MRFGATSACRSVEKSPRTFVHRFASFTEQTPAPRGSPAESWHQDNIASVPDAASKQDTGRYRLLIMEVFDRYATLFSVAFVASISIPTRQPHPKHSKGGMGPAIVSND